MEEITIFGKKYIIVEKRAKKDNVRFRNKNLHISYCETDPSSLLEEFLADRLYSQLVNIYNRMKDEGKIEILGNLEFEVVQAIDNKRKRIAKFKRRKILVGLSAVALRTNALKYLVAHEVAHTFTKAHTEKFWSIVRTMYPGFKRGEDLLMRFEPSAYGTHFSREGG